MHLPYNTIQYKICKAPCCRGFRGFMKQASVACINLMHFLPVFTVWCHPNGALNIGDKSLQAFTWREKYKTLVLLTWRTRSTRLLYFFRHVKACKTEGKIFICTLHGDNISQNSICSNYKALLTSGPLHVSQLGRTGKSAKKSQATLKYYISHNFWSKKKVKLWLKSVFNR